MEIVIDSSVIIAVIANEPEKEVLIPHTIGAKLLAPHSVHWEIGNAFSAMMRRKRITLSEAMKSLEIYHQIPIRYVDIEMDEALRIAAELNLYAYDAYLLRCAMKYNAPIITLDQILEQRAQTVNVKIIKV